jgi:shikimate dehydrogenase
VTRTLPGRLVLLGHPVAHSLSPRFQNAALRAAGIALVYEALDTPGAALDATLLALRESNAAGNVTVPHKVAVAQRCQRLTSLAKRLGAVNTFWHDNGELVGDNTDVVGFEAMAKSLGVVSEGAVVACLGAGGAARAACAAIERWPGASIRLFTRGEQRAEELHDLFPELIVRVPTLDAAVRDARVVVNTTPIGMTDDSVPIEISRLPRDADVMDLVYRPAETRWVREARIAGHRAADGREMLLWQGVSAFERWFAHTPDVSAMRSALERGASLT